MDDSYQKIELQFYRDLKKSENEYLEHKNIVESVMKENSIDYALEIVENQKKNAYQENYIKGYTLNLIIKKIDLHYVLKILDQNKIGFYASDDDKWNAIFENSINEEDEFYEEEMIENEIQKENEIDEEELEKRNEVNNTFVRVFFSIIFIIMVVLEICLAYYCYTIKKYKYLAIIIIIIVLQIPFYNFFLKVFKNKKDKIEYL